MDNTFCVFRLNLYTIYFLMIDYLTQACPVCCSEWPNLSMKNSIISPVILTQMMASGLTNDGESPSFVASIAAFSGFQKYCTVVRSLLCTDISSELISSILFISQIPPAAVPCS